MDVDFSIELGREDAVLDFPWKDPSGAIAYVDLKRHPELFANIGEAIAEAQKFPELGEFLRTVNSARSLLETAKCDAWETTDLNAEEEIYNASHKFASYVDLVFSEIDSSRSLPLESPSPESSLRESLPAHEQFAKKLTALLRRAPEMPASAEVCVRRCYYGEENGVREGFYFTFYASGYGGDGARARQNWGVGLKLMGNAIMQLSAGG
ncbi:MAG: hypothetical protein ABSB87_19390 [Terriglobales bacterium]|jgi:hypothetical protein